MTRRLAAVLLLAAAGCSNNEQYRSLPDGSYAGSTRDRKAIVVDVGGGGLRVDGHDTLRGEDGEYVEEKPPRRRLTCRSVAGGDELVCEVAWAGHTETVELMKL